MQNFEKPWIKMKQILWILHFETFTTFPKVKTTVKIYVVWKKGWIEDSNFSNIANTVWGTRKNVFDKWQDFKKSKHFLESFFSIRYKVFDWITKTDFNV